MKNEMIEAIRSVLKEELKTVNHRLDGVDTRLEELKDEMEKNKKNIIQSIGEYSEKNI